MRQGMRDAVLDELAKKEPCGSPGRAQRNGGQNGGPTSMRRQSERLGFEAASESPVRYESWWIVSSVRFVGGGSGATPVVSRPIPDAINVPTRRC